METGTLYIVSTPIGNLSDISLRAKEILSSVDFIAAEDTRVTIKLLNRFAINKPLISYYEHNRRERGEEILVRLQNGQSCALVSDAGTPAISDPGQDLVFLCANAGVTVYSVPGPCAAIAALSVSGLETGRFTFEGFLSMNKKSRLKHLTNLQTEKRTMVFYEAPHKLKATLADLLKTFGDRPISLSRELTKIHEETLRMSLCEAVSYFENTAPRGEFVLCIEGLNAGEEQIPDEIDPLEIVEKLISEGQSLSDAVKNAAKQAGVPKNDLYKNALLKFM